METLPCPMCHQQTDSLKVYRLPTFLLFVFFGASFRHDDIAACPPCMRGKLAKLAAINVLPANLLWLILLMPWYTIAALRTLTNGHSTRAHGFSSPVPAGDYRSASGANAIAALSSEQAKPWHREPSLQGYFSADAPDDIEANFVLPHSAGTERLKVRFLRREGTCYRATLLLASTTEPGLHAGLEVLVRPSQTHPPLAWVPPAAFENLEGWRAKCPTCQFDLAYTPALELARQANPTVLAGQEPSTLACPCASCGNALTLTKVKKTDYRAVVDAAKAAKSFAWGLGTSAETMWLASFGLASAASLLGIGLAATFSSESKAVLVGYAASLLIGVTLFGWRGLLWARQRQGSGVIPWVAALIGGILFPALALFFFEGIFPSL